MTAAAALLPTATALGFSSNVPAVVGEARLRMLNGWDEYAAAYRSWKRSDD